MNFKNIFNFNKKEEDLSVEERRGKALKTLLIYGIFFAFIMIFSMLSSENKNNNNKTQNNNYEIKESMNVLFEEINKNNFEGSINITADADIVLVQFQRDNIDKELISKKYREETFNYLREKNIYYEVDLEKGTHTKKENVKIYNDYDTTFLSTENIIKLITNIKKIDLKEETYNIARYKISLINAINIYNEINNANYTTDSTEEVVIDVNYDKNISQIIIDMTKIHNIVRNTTYNKVTYTLSFDKINKIDLSSIDTEGI